MSGAKILIVEDEPDISNFLCMELEHEGYNTGIARDGRVALKMFEDYSYDLVLLDVLLPSLNGMEVLRRIRKISPVPIIMLTCKNEISDKVVGLDLGANDYMAKPFAIEELLARVRSLLRSAESIKALALGDRRIAFDDLFMDCESRTVSRAGRIIELTKKEYLVLELLLKNMNSVVTRETLITKIWGENFSGDTNALDVYIRHLRIKIDEGAQNKVISTVRGVGYIVKEQQ